LINIIHEIFSENVLDYINKYNPNYDVHKVLNHIVSCRTPGLGAAVYNCECGERTFVYHSCRDRHCPICQNINNAAWADKQMASSLPVKYFHIVFTLPDTLNSFVLSHQREAYNALFDAASSALLKLCDERKYLGATPGFTAVLHTWGQTMQFHPHLHVIITAGGLSEDGTRFVDKSESDFFLPVKVLSKLFRGIFLSTLDKKVPLPLELKHSLYQTDFFCYLDNPFDRPDNLVKYLARYVNRVCISDKRIVSYDRVDKTVTFRYKDNRDNGRQKEMTLHVLEFMRRFLLHVLPARFMKIRHFGILKNHDKFQRLRRCRRLLVSFAPPVKAKSRQCMVCPKCGASLSNPAHMNAAELQLVLRC